MKLRILGSTVSGLLLGASMFLTGCGGDGDDTGKTPIPPIEDTLEDHEFRFIGKANGAGPEAEVTIIVGNKTYRGITASQEEFIIDVALDELTADRPVHIKASGTNSMQHVTLASIVPDADRVKQIGGNERTADIDDVREIALDAMSTGTYATLFVANGGQHPSSTSRLLELERDLLDGDKALLLAAANRLVVEENYPLPSGIANTWQLLTDFQKTTYFLQDVRQQTVAAAPNLQSKGLQQADAVDAVVNELLDEALVFTAESLPESYVLTQITRDLSDFKGGALLFSSDGTGTHITPAGESAMTWEIDAEGALVVMPVTSKPMVFEFVIESDPLNGDTVLEVNQTVNSMRFRKLREGENADALMMEMDITLAAAPGSNVPDSSVFVNPLQQVFRESVIAVKPGGHASFVEDEVAGVWALPGVKLGETMFGRHYVAPQKLPFNAHMADEGLIEFNIDQTGTIVDTLESFSWAISEEGHLLLTFADDSSIEYRKARVEGDVIDIAAFIENPETGEIHVNGGFGLRTDPAFTFAAGTAPGTYVRFGESDRTLEDFNSEYYDMHLLADGTALWWDNMNGASRGMDFPVPDMKWNAGSGALQIEEIIGTLDWVYQPHCSLKCWRAASHTLVPLRQVGNFIYALEISEAYRLDEAAPLWQGDVWQRRAWVVYWEKTSDDVLMEF